MQTQSKQSFRIKNEKLNYTYLSYIVSDQDADVKRVSHQPWYIQPFNYMCMSHVI
jgi:hypothetical protein